MPDDEDRLEQNDRRRRARRAKPRGKHAPGLGTREGGTRYRNRSLEGWERAAPEWLDPQDKP